MSIGHVRPVGEQLPLRPGRSPRFAWPPGYSVAWLDSGTTALGVALRAVAARSGRASPSVLLPGYTCPDVIAAAAWAGLRAVLVDTRPGTPWLDEDRLPGCLDETTVAVVAPHFLGLPHPLESLAAACRNAGIALIEDSAQLGPASPAFKPAAELVVLSFGRGKPVPAGGGALLYPASDPGVVERQLSSLPQGGYSETGWTAFALLQNAAMSRPGYALVRKVPGLHVGETRFRPLRAPHAMPPAAGRRVERILAGWRPPVTDIQLQIRGMLDRAGYRDLPGMLGWDGRAPLLRYPLLMHNEAERDHAWRRLERRGLGASALYRQALPDIEGMPTLAMPGGITNAREFASRLLTLPAHSGVTAADLEEIGSELAALSRDQGRVAGIA